MKDREQQLFISHVFAVHTHTFIHLHLLAVSKSILNRTMPKTAAEWLFVFSNLQAKCFTSGPTSINDVTAGWFVLAPTVTSQIGV